MNIYSIKASVAQAPERIKEKLDERSIKRCDMAKELQIDRTHYYKMLNGKENMPVDIIVLHSVYLKVSASYLLVGDESLSLQAESVEDIEKIEWLLEKVILLMERMDKKERCRFAFHAIERIAKHAELTL